MKLKSKLPGVIALIASVVMCSSAFALEPIPNCPNGHPVDAENGCRLQDDTCCWYWCDNDECEYYIDNKYSVDHVFVDGFCQYCGYPEPVPVAVEDVVLSTNELHLGVHQVYTLEATVLPPEAADVTLTWYSDTEPVAVVTNGSVTAISQGQAIITAGVGEGDDTKSGTCIVHVHVCSVIRDGVEVWYDTIADAIDGLKGDETVDDIVVYDEKADCPEGYKIQKNPKTEEGTYKVIEIAGQEAKIADETESDGYYYYAKIGGALEAAVSNDTIIVNADCETLPGATYEAEVLFIDLGGKKLTVNTAAIPAETTLSFINDSDPLAGGLYVVDNISVQGTLDLSGLRWSADNGGGLVADQDGSLTIGANGKVIMPAGTDITPNAMIYKNFGFFKETAEKAKVVVLDFNGNDTTWTWIKGTENSYGWQIDGETCQAEIAVLQMDGYATLDDAIKFAMPNGKIVLTGRNKETGDVVPSPFNNGTIRIDADGDDEGSYEIDNGVTLDTLGRQIMLCTEGAIVEVNSGVGFGYANLAKPDGFYWAKPEANGTYDVYAIIASNKCAAAIGETGYREIADAIDGLNDGQTLDDIIVLDPTASCPEGYAIQETVAGNGNWKVIDLNDYVAYVSNTGRYYANALSALNAVTNNNTVTFINDGDIPNNNSFPTDLAKKFTVDLGSNTLSIAAAMLPARRVKLSDGTEMTISNGTIVVECSRPFMTQIFSIPSGSRIHMADETAFINVNTGATLSDIKNRLTKPEGYYWAKNVIDGDYNVIAIIASNKCVAAIGETGYVTIADAIDDLGDDPNDKLDQIIVLDPTAPCPDGYGIQDDKVIAFEKFEASIDGYFYTTIEDALNIVKLDQTIVVNKDCDVDPNPTWMPARFTVDLAGNNLTVNDATVSLGETITFVSTVETEEDAEDAAKGGLSLGGKINLIGTVDLSALSNEVAGVDFANGSIMIAETGLLVLPVDFDSTPNAIMYANGNFFSETEDGAQITVPAIDEDGEDIVWTWKKGSEVSYGWQIDGETCQVERSKLKIESCLTLDAALTFVKDNCSIYLSADAPLSENSVTIKSIGDDGEYKLENGKTLAFNGKKIVLSDDGAEVIVDDGVEFDADELLAAIEGREIKTVVGDGFTSYSLWNAADDARDAAIEALAGVVDADDTFVGNILEGDALAEVKDELKDAYETAVKALEDAETVDDVEAAKRAAIEAVNDVADEAVKGIPAGVPVPVSADYDGDGIADIAIFDADGVWYVRGSSTGWRSEPFGSADCIPVPADYDGDGKADLSVYDTVTGDWFMRYTTGLNGQTWGVDNFGALTCTPVPADYDGDGIADLSVYDQQTGDWFVRFSSGDWTMTNFGANTCIPVPADYDGDGKDDFSVYDQQSGDWWIRYSKGLNGNDWAVDNFGAGTCVPVPADHDGDGKADLAVYDQQTGDWFVRFSSGDWTKENFGANTCVPVPADYDGDGKDDFSVYDAGTKTFWLRYSVGGWDSVVF